MNRIALVEDNQRLAALLVEALRNAGIETDVFNRMQPLCRPPLHNRGTQRSSLIAGCLTAMGSTSSAICAPPGTEHPV